MSDEVIKIPATIEIRQAQTEPTLLFKVVKTGRYSAELEDTSGRRFVVRKGDTVTVRLGGIG